MGGQVNGRGIIERTYEGRNFVLNSTTLEWEAMTQPGASAPGASSTQVSIKEILTSSGGTIIDSTEVALKVNVVAGSAAGSTEVTVRQSSAGDLNVTVGASALPSGAATAAKQDTGNATLSVISAVIQAANVANASDLWIPVLGYDGTLLRPLKTDSSGSLQIKQASTVWAAQLDGRVRAQNSTIGDLLASVQQNSTVWPVQMPTSQSFQVKNSTIGDLLASVQQNSTTWAVQIDGRVRAQNSTIGDLLASVQQNSTVWQTQAVIRDSSGVAYAGLTSRPSTGAQAMPTREVLNNLLSTCFSSLGNNSTSATVVTSAASLRHKVYAYSITSTAQAVNTLSFASSLGNPIWQVQMQSITSGITGANLAVSPPAWLFATEAASPLVFKVTGSSGTYHVSFSYFSEA